MVRRIISIACALAALAACELPYVDEERQGTVAYFMVLEDATGIPLSDVTATVTLRHRWFGLRHEKALTFITPSTSMPPSTSGMISPLPKGPWRVTVRVSIAGSEIGVERYLQEINEKNLEVLNITVSLAGGGAAIDFTHTSDLAAGITYDGFLRRTFRENGNYTDQEDYYQLMGEGDLTGLMGVGVAARLNSDDQTSPFGTQLEMDPGSFQTYWSYRDYFDSNAAVEGVYTIDSDGYGGFLYDELAIPENNPWLQDFSPSYFASVPVFTPIGVDWSFDRPVELDYGTLVYASEDLIDFYTVSVDLRNAFSEIIPAVEVTASNNAFILLIGHDKALSVADWATIRSNLGLFLPPPFPDANVFMEQVVAEIASLNRDIDNLIIANRSIWVGP